MRIPLSGKAPSAIAIAIVGSTAWVLAVEGGSLMEVDLERGREVRAIDVGFGASHLALQPGGLAAVGRFDDSGSGSYLVLADLLTRELRGVETGELGSLTGGEGSVVWALEKADRLVKVNTRTSAVIDDAVVEVGENVHVEVKWGAGSAWVGSDGLPVVRIDGVDLTDQTTIEVTSGIPFLFEAGLMWGAGPTELWAIDPATNEVTRHIPLDDVMEILALDIEGDDAWLAVRRPGYIGRVLRLSLASGEVVEEYTVSLPAAVGIDADRAWIASYETNELLGFPR
jgi:hypothetical protein